MPDERLRVTYLSNAPDRDFILKAPWEWNIRNPESSRLINTLLHEHENYSYLKDKNEHVHGLVLFVFIDSPPDESLISTLRSWALQSYQGSKLVLISENADIKSKVEEWLASNWKNGSWCVDTRISEYLSRSEKFHFGFFARQGDLLHPSLVSSVIDEGRRSKAQVLTWNSLFLNKSGKSSDVVKVALRRSGRELFSILNANYSDMSFASDGLLIKKFLSIYPAYNFADEGHLYLCWLCTQSNVIWVQIPQYFQIRKSSEEGDAPYTYSFSYYQKVLESFLRRFDLKLTTVDSPGKLPYVMNPQSIPKMISIIIPFRNKSELTLRCLRSVIDQQINCKLQIILINNNSSLAEVQRLTSGIKALGSSADVIIENYNKPFNHSAQCNLGVSFADGDVVIFLNNDAQITSPDLIDKISKWALVPGVGTVGARIVRQNGQLACSGIRIKSSNTHQNDQPLDESRDALFSNNCREVFGNTFACAAISKERFKEVGLLDDLNFPIGYNDAEFCIRARRKGFFHLYLGELSLAHETASSRRHVDGYRELTLIKRFYPEMLNMASYQLENDQGLLNMTYHFNDNSILRSIFRGILKTARNKYKTCLQRHGE